MDYINKEIAINYGHTKFLWDKQENENFDEILSYNVACDIMNGDSEHEPIYVVDCQNRHDWMIWKEAIQAELNSLNKRKVFGPIVLSPEVVKPIRYTI